MSEDNENLFWFELVEELEIGTAHLLRKYDIELDRDDEKHQLTLYKFRPDGFKSYVEIRLHEAFCLISVSAVISKTRDEYYTASTGDIIRVFNADGMIFEIARAAEIGISRTLSWGRDRLKFVTPPWHKNKKRR